MTLLTKKGRQFLHEKSKKTQELFLKEMKNLLRREVIPRKFELVAWRDDNEDTIVALNPMIGVMNCMNPTLGLIFKLCDDKNTINNIKEKLHVSFPIIDEKVIHSDLRNAIIQLFSNGYIIFKMKHRSKYNDVYVTDIYNKIKTKAGEEYG